MIHSFTPSTTKKNERTDLHLHLPSKFTLKFILGYSAALKVIKLHSLGNSEVILN